MSDFGQASSIRKLAKEIKEKPLVPTLHLGTVTAVTTNTCSLYLDGDTGFTHHNVRFAQSAWPIVGDVVQIVEWSGDLWITSILQKQGWVLANLGAGVSSYDTATHNTIGYRRLPAGQVELRGVALATGGTPTLFTLDAEYRPSKLNILRAAITSGGVVVGGYVSVGSGGSVVSNAAANQFTYLDGLVFSIV